MCECMSECECQCECAWGGLGANWFSGAENQEIYVRDTLAIKIIAGMCCLQVAASDRRGDTL